MFGISSGVDDDEDMSDNSSIPMSYQHFNPAVRPRSKLGRRKLIQPKEAKPVEVPKAEARPRTTSSQWTKDDSGIFPSDSTPSLTHPVSRGGNVNFNAKLGGPFTSTFTPSFKSNQENLFNKFALPSTPRFRNEPLKEINDIDNVSYRDSQEKLPLSDVSSSKDCQDVQKQLNKSFISEEPRAGSGAADKTANETSDFSNDSSFMTCHDLHVQQPNKTLYDPAFLKTPGRNLAEIRIEESPFNPLENFLEESEDFDVGKTPLSSRNKNEAKAKTEGPNDSLNVDESRFSGALAFPLDCSSVDDTAPSGQNNQPVKREVDAQTGKQDSVADSRERACSGSHMHSADSEFKHPSLALHKTPHRAGYKEEIREHTTPSSGYISEKSFQTEETTHVTYPQPSKSVLGQKNTFTSQFSLNSYKPGISNSVKVLSSGNQGCEPVSAASLKNAHGMLSSHFDQGYGSQNGRMVHRMGNVRDSSGGLDKPVVPGFGQSTLSKTELQGQSDELDSTSGLSERTVVSRNARESGPGGGYEHDTTHTATPSTKIGSDATVVARVQAQPHQRDLKQPNPQSTLLQQNGHHPIAQQQQNKLPGQHLPNRTQYCGQQLSSGGLREHSRPGGQQSRLQSDIRDCPQVQNQQTRPQSAGQVQPNPNNVHQHPTRPQSAGPAQSDPVNANSVLSALMKPQPQNVITIKGTPYTVLSLLGKGGSSQVYQALGPQSSKLMAIKCVNLASVEEAMATDYLNEIALLSKLQGCPSVIKMFDHEYVERSQMLYVVLEKGDIDFSKLIKNISENNQISMPMILYYWSEMLNAVHEIHKRGIIHSDLKPANFLLVEGRLKLIDFGIASSIQGDTTSVMKDVPAGTYNYMSPESITGPKITRKSDVWSMGCILFNLLYGRTPFSHLNNRWQKLHAIADVNHPVTFPQLKHHAPPSLRLALRWCLNKDPALRPTVEELVTLSELSPPAESGLGREIDGMMCQYFRRVLPNLRNLKEDAWELPK